MTVTSPKGPQNQNRLIVFEKKDSLTQKDSEWIPTNPKGDSLLKIVSGNPHKVYTLKLMKGDKLLIRLKSTDKKIDPLVALEDSKNKLIAYNDDEDYANHILDSKLVVTIPEDGEYRIIATCSHEEIPNKHGDFHLTVEKTSTIPTADTKGEPSNIQKPADTQAELSNDAKIVGTWEIVQSTEKNAPPSGSMVELTKDGKVKVFIKADKQAIAIEGTYTVDGDKLIIVTPRPDGKDATDTMKIIGLTDKELVTEEMMPGNTGRTELRKK